MPSGAAKNKKRKAAKRKNQKMTVDIAGDNQQQGSPPSPNCSSDFLSPQVEFQGNRHERRRSAIDEDFEETFETPRFQPETSRFPPETPYYSMENLNLKNGRSEVNVLIDESSKSLHVEIPLKEEEENSKEMKSEESGVVVEISDGLHQEFLSEEGEDGEKDNRGLKEMLEKSETKLDENEEKSPVKEEEEEEMLEKSENEEKSPVKKEEEVMLEKSEVEHVPLIEKSVSVDEERTRSVSIEKVDVSSSNEKEVEVVPWPDLQISAGNGAVNVDVEIICSEKGGDDDNRNLERELNLERNVMENKQPFPVDENLKDVVEGMLPQNDVDLTNNKFDISAEKISVSAENSALITEEASHGGKAPDENSECLVGKLDASMMNTAAEPSSDAEKSGIAQRDKVARGPGGTHRAKVWNCCGLFDVFTGSCR